MWAVSFCVLPPPTSCHPFISAFPPFFSLDMFYSPPIHTTEVFFFCFNNKLCNLFQKKVSYIIYIHSIVPGDWMSWSGWSRCSATCGTGVRWRTRDCNETSYGDLTAPCEGTSNGTEDCNTFPCRPFGT